MQKLFNGFQVRYARTTPWSNDGFRRATTTTLRRWCRTSRAETHRRRHGGLRRL